MRLPQKSNRLPEAAKHRILLLWIGTTFLLLFCGPFLFESTNSLLNILNVLFFLPALGLLAHQTRQGTLSRTDFKPAWPLLAFLAWTSTSVLWADTANASRTLHGAVQIATFTFLLCWLKKQHEQVLLRGLAAGATSLVIFLAVISFGFYINHELTTPLYATGRSLPFGLPEMNMLRLTMIATFTIFVLTALHFQSSYQTERIVFMVLAAVLVALLMLTQRRTALVALSGGLIVAILLTRSRALIMVMALVLLTGGLFLLIDINGYLSDGSSYRLELWSAYIQRAMEAPLNGIGLPDHPRPATVPDGQGSTFTGSHAHNIYIAVFVYTGLIGLALFALAWLYPALTAWRYGIFDKSKAVYFLAAPPALLVMLFNGGYPILPFQPNWFGLWIPLSLLIASTVGSKSRYDS